MIAGARACAWIPARRHGRTRAPTPRGVLDHIARDAEPRHYGDGDILFREGDPSDCLYVLLKGQLKVYSRNANGREMVFNVLRPRRHRRRAVPGRRRDRPR